MIREATVDDKPRLVEMATRFILSSSYRDYLQVVPEKISAHVDNVLEHGVIFVCERVTLTVPQLSYPGRAPIIAGSRDHPPIGSDHNLVGMLAMVGPVELIDGQRYAEEVAWWVEPEHRNGTIGPRLMHHMEGWCGQNSVYMVKMLAPAGSDVGDFYAKCGYRAVETAWVKVFSEWP